jgi:hypothetical protein
MIRIRLSRESGKAKRAGEIKEKPKEDVLAAGDLDDVPASWVRPVGWLRSKLGLAL